MVSGLALLLEPCRSGARIAVGVSVGVGKAVPSAHGLGCTASTPAACTCPSGWRLLVPASGLSPAPFSAIYRLHSYTGDTVPSNDSPTEATMSPDDGMTIDERRKYLRKMRKGADSFGKVFICANDHCSVRLLLFGFADLAT